MWDRMLLTVFKRTRESYIEKRESIAQGHGLSRLSSRSLSISKHLVTAAAASATVLIRERPTRAGNSSLMRYFADRRCWLQ